MKYAAPNRGDHVSISVFTAPPFKLYVERVIGFDAERLAFEVVFRTHDKEDDVPIVGLIIPKDGRRTPTKEWVIIDPKAPLEARPD